MTKDETWLGVRKEEIKREQLIIFLSQRDNRDDLGTWDNEELECLLNDDPDWEEPNYNELLKVDDGKARSGAGASEESTPGLANNRYKYVSVRFDFIVSVISSTPTGATPGPFNKHSRHPPNRSLDRASPQHWH